MTGSEYSITIRSVVVDGMNLFQAAIKELPDIAEYGETYAEAYELAVDSIKTTAEIFAEEGRAMPAPLRVEDDYSGRVTLRLPKSLHRRIALDAENEGVSLNQHIVGVLTYSAGYDSGAGRPVEESSSAGICSVAETVVAESRTPKITPRTQVLRQTSAQLVLSGEDDYQPEFEVKRALLRVVK